MGLTSHRPSGSIRWLASPNLAHSLLSNRQAPELCWANCRHRCDLPVVTAKARTRLPRPADSGRCSDLRSYADSRRRERRRAGPVSEDSRQRRGHSHGRITRPPESAAGHAGQDDRPADPQAAAEKLLPRLAARAAATCREGTCRRRWLTWKEAMGISKVSKSQVTQLAKELDGVVRSFRERSPTAASSAFGYTHWC